MLKFIDKARAFRTTKVNKNVEQNGTRLKFFNNKITNNKTARQTNSSSNNNKQTNT